MEDSIFIKLLEWGEKVGIEGVTWKEVKHWAYENKLVSTTEQSNLNVQLLLNLLQECFVDASGSSPRKYNLKSEYYFRLIEFRELQEAREASKKANKNAIAAIIISTLAIMVSVFMSIRPAKLDDAQVRQLLNPTVAIESSQLATIFRDSIQLDEAQLDTILNAIRDRKATSKPKQNHKSASNDP